MNQELTMNEWLHKLFTSACLGLMCLCCTASWADAGRYEGDVILLGMSTALSGPAAELGQNMLDGVNAGLYRFNQQGGINNRKVKVIALDDGYEPNFTIPNMHRLIDEYKVLAVIGNVGTPTAIAAIPIANQKRTLLFAPYTGAGTLRKNPPDRYVINYRASYAQETAVMIDALIDHAGLKPEEIAFFTQLDSYGDAGFFGGIAALKRHGLVNESAVTHTRYQRNTMAVENSIADILLADPAPRAIIMVGAYEPSAKFIKLARKNGIKATFLNVSFVGSEPLQRQFDSDIENIIITQVVPHHADTTLQIVRDFHTDLQTLYPDVEPTFGALEGYIASQILVKAMGPFQVVPSRESLIDALEEMGTFDIGLGVDLTLNSEEHQASEKVWPTILINSEFQSFLWKDLMQYIN